MAIKLNYVASKNTMNTEYWGVFIFAVERSQQRKWVWHIILCCLDLNVTDMKVRLCKNCVLNS